MSRPTNVVSIHPYFKPHPGKVEAFRAALPNFVAKTASEEKCLYYEFTFNGDEFFCREGYLGAEAALAHLQNVGPDLQEALKIAELTRLEIHGPAGELEKLRGPLAALKISWFVTECGVA